MPMHTFVLPSQPLPLGMRPALDTIKPSVSHLGLSDPTQARRAGSVDVELGRPTAHATQGVLGHK
jgi:hypothetical protein